MRWRTLPAGWVEVEGPSGWTRPVLNLDRPGARATLARTARWLPLLGRHARRVGVHVAHLAGLVFRESGGDPDAVNPEKLPGPEDDGVGLMQLTHPSLKALVRPGERLADPEVNVRIGADYWASLWRGVGRGDLPRTGAAYNAGGVRWGGPPPWGLVTTPGHVDGVVRASNTFLLNAPPRRAADRGGLLLAGAAALVLLGGRF